MTVVRRSALALAVLVAALTPAAALAHGHGAAHHSLRASVTDQNFYFVMADRFNNGDTANDNGGLPPGKGEGQSGFDPTVKGWYHGGDLKGLTAKLGYIQGHGTTALWLTPSFKNKAVQLEDGQAAGREVLLSAFPHRRVRASDREVVQQPGYARGMAQQENRRRVGGHVTQHLDQLRD